MFRDSNRSNLLIIFLMICASSGIIACIFVHLRMCVYDFVPSQMLVNILNAGFIAIGSFRILIRKHLQAKNKVDSEKFRQDVNKFFPDWLKVATGIMATYGVIAFVLFLGMAISIAQNDGGSETLLSYRFLQGLSALQIVFYVVEFTQLYCLNCYLKANNSFAIEKSLAEKY